jgi:hypothetical protein
VGTSLGPTGNGCGVLPLFTAGIAGVGLLGWERVLAGTRAEGESVAAGVAGPANGGSELWTGKGDPASLLPR